MTCYKVLNVANAHVVCVLPVVHTPILSYYIILSYEMSVTK